MSYQTIPVDGDQRVPIHVWSRAITQASIKQLQKLAAQPYVWSHIAAMPDVHVASGVAVGTVFATQHHVVPAALGGDLGCGISALPFPFPASALSERHKQHLLTAISKVIPVGDAQHSKRHAPVLPDSLLEHSLSTHKLDKKRDISAPCQLGTLGGGNHFLELEQASDDQLWLLVHTGSRGMGGAIREHHQRAAEHQLPTSLSALDTREEQGQAYLQDLAWALAFARANRQCILSKASEVISDLLDSEPLWEKQIDIHHNFVASEQHFDQQLWIHRKGAVRARKGDAVIIPGSMGTASYLGEGLGCELAFGSCSHGAGRVMARGEAHRTISLQAFEKAMRRVVFDSQKKQQLVEEAPQAYREIKEVLEDEEELVFPTLRLRPLLVIKG
jgi:tRNA-splicing ligase RtcB (3'-phosphate/5'-hydroxy nucleic acid ligase)